MARPTELWSTPHRVVSFGWRWLGKTRMDLYGQRNQTDPAGPRRGFWLFPPPPFIPTLVTVPLVGARVSASLCVGCRLRPSAYRLWQVLRRVSCHTVSAVTALATTQLLGNPSRESLPPVLPRHESQLARRRSSVCDAQHPARICRTLIDDHRHQRTSSFQPDF